ncbi:LysR family transcriptional regulator [Tropicimonas sp. IMCC34011]|uniref:LysR family transcriptional regulator n=1 Tax=Tropicimonas sp. IMCC34011 TaxID=2248759 RepID=UPI000E227F00|nr:LysR family transcriptional regulator [Tropicimonas sp. IMCC34011]
MTPNISFRQLLTFVEVMRTGTLSDAARTLGRTQPSVSTAISGLETEIGFPLFKRERKRIIPRPEAYYFLEEAQAIMDRFARSTRTLQEIGNLRKGKLRIACNPAAANFFMPQVLSDYLVGKPDLFVSLMMRSSTVVADWIASQQYDIGFGETPPARTTIQTQNFSFPCLCAVSMQSPLKDLKIITPEHLEGVPMAMLNEEHTITVKTSRAFETFGVPITKRFEFQTFQPALHLTSKGQCAVICDSFSAFSHRQEYPDRSDIVFRPFEPAMYLDMSLMTPANRPLSMLAEEFLGELGSRLGAYLAFQG